MAVTNDVDWPWDSALVERSELARIARNDRKPGRTPPRDRVPWLAHATPAWSLAHLNDDPADVTTVLKAALARQLPSVKPLTWHHTSVHRWRYARFDRIATNGLDCFWNDALGIGVCGDAFGAGNVEAAWSSGDELANAMSASFDAVPEPVGSPDARFEIEPALDLADAVH